MTRIHGIHPHREQHSLRAEHVYGVHARASIRGNQHCRQAHRREQRRDDAQRPDIHRRHSYSSPASVCDARSVSFHAKRDDALGLVVRKGPEQNGEQDRDIAVGAPTPSASVTTAIEANSGRRHQCLSANRRSDVRVSRRAMIAGSMTRRLLSCHQEIRHTTEPSPTDHRR